MRKYQSIRDVFFRKDSIYAAAFQFAQKAVDGIEPGEVLFADDLERNARGAKEFGFDAVKYFYKDHEAFLQQLRSRGVL